MMLYTEIITDNLTHCLMCIRYFIQPKSFLAKVELWIQNGQVYISRTSPPFLHDIIYVNTSAVTDKHFGRIESWCHLASSDQLRG